jgi:hypothetical protein
MKTNTLNFSRVLSPSAVHFMAATAVTLLAADCVFAQTNDSPRRAQIPIFSADPSVAELWDATNSSALTEQALRAAAGMTAPYSGTTGLPSMAISQTTSNAILNVNFGWGTQKIGSAAIGQATNDFWNWCNTAYKDPFYMTGLAWSDGSGSGAGLEVHNGRGLWGSGSPDPMYDSFVYPSGGGDITVVLTNLAADTYDFYVYAHDGSATGNSVLELWVNNTSYGQKGTSIWGPGANTTNWEGGQQYVLYRNVVVSNGAAILLDVQPGSKGYAMLNGMQVVRSSAISRELPPMYRLVDVNIGGLPQKIGLAAIGLTTNDTWNWYDSTFYGQPSGALANLVLAENTATSAGMVLTNGAGYWGMEAGDAMYNTFVYPRSPGNIGIVFTNLATDGLTADFYLYGHAYNADENTVFQLTTGGTNYGPRGTSIWGTSWSTANWEEGAQYVVFRNIPISTNAPVYITAQPGLSGYPKINGIQIAVPLDRDGNGLPDWWEAQYFGHIGTDPNADSDGDGLTNWEEYKLGLDPLNADTGGTGVRDGDKDTDNDGISNLAELGTYHSSPWNAHTFNANRDDGEYLFTAPGVPEPAPGDPCTCDTLANLFIKYIGGNRVQLTIKNAPADSVYDLYYLESLNYGYYSGPWRPIWPGVHCDSSGQATVVLDEPTFLSGYFIIFDARDDDGDGLSNGYECLFKYANGKKSCAQNAFSAHDLIDDGWRVEYGFDPTLSSGNGAQDANPDGDSDPNNPTTPFSNYSEYQEYIALTGQFDPLKPYGTGQDRPIITVSADQNPTCEVASFTIHRSSVGTALDIYYALGGGLAYNVDYMLTPQPPMRTSTQDGYPRIFIAHFGQNDQDFTVQATLQGHPVTSGQKTLVIALTPYPGAPPTPLADPNLWTYVVDRPVHASVATITFNHDTMVPTAMPESAQTCPTERVTVPLAEINDCGLPVTFTVENPPKQGSLGPITQAGNTATIPYTPASDYCGGKDSFTYKVSNAIGESAPATVDITVGDPAPQAFCRDVITPVNTTANFTLKGYDSCNAPLTFFITDRPSKGQYQLNSATGAVIYQPDPNYEGYDSITFGVRNCAFSSTQDKTVNIYVVPPPKLITACRTMGILLHWSASMQVLPQVFYDFRIYRCDTAPGCTPILIATVPGTARTYLDANNIQQGHTYCYSVTFRHQDECDTASLYESPPSNQSCNQSCPQPPAAVLITGNSADGGDGKGPIYTFDFSTGNLLRLCYPMRADGSYEPNGRGLAIHSGQIFFTETKVPASDPIHIIPYNSQGQTSDSATLPNNTGRHIQDLKFYNNYLFALAGYGENNGLSIFKLDPSDGSVINSFPVTGGPQTSDSDGFVVLPPNGHFLINDGDGGDGITTYREYDEGGVIVANGVVIHLSDYGFSSGTGVALGPDGSSLYFLADINSPSGQVVVRTDLAGNLLDFQSISANNLEDLDVVAP